MGTSVSLTLPIWFIFFLHLTSLIPEFRHHQYWGRRWEFLWGEWWQCICMFCVALAMFLYQSEYEVHQYDDGYDDGPSPPSALFLFSLSLSPSIWMSSFVWIFSPWLFFVMSKSQNPWACTHTLKLERRKSLLKRICHKQAGIAWVAQDRPFFIMEVRLSLLVYDPYI